MKFDKYQYVLILTGNIGDDYIVVLCRLKINSESHKSNLSLL